VTPAQDDLAALWQPLRLRGVELPNRVMTSAMTLQYGEDDRMTERHAAFYLERARGGVGLLFSEQLSASPISESPFGRSLPAYDAGRIASMATTTAALAVHPTRFFAQLFAGGASGGSTVGLDGWGPIRAPSRIGRPGGEAPLPLHVDEIAQIAADFATSARNVVAAGADGVEVHGAHGWLVGQFLSPFYNRREDAYGGPVENRCAMAIEVGRAIRAAIGEAVPLGLALSYDELIGAAGITPQDTLDQLRVLTAAGVYDFFDLSIGSNHSTHHTIAPMSVPPGFSLGFAQRAREQVAGAAAVFAAGRVVDPRMAAQAVAAGQVDVVAMSRAHLADPHLLARSRAGQPAIRCVGANACVRRALENEPVGCVLNPVTGREATWSASPPRAAAPRSVLVVGAGPAGLRCAAVAAGRGHRVVVHERSARPGGHLRLLADLPTRASWEHAIEDQVAQLQAAGGRIVLGRELTAQDVLDAAPDVVVVATGATWDATGAAFDRPDRERVPGLDGVRALGLDAALEATADDPHALGRRVAIVQAGGAYAPLGLAERLAGAGVAVHVVTADLELGHHAAAELELAHLLPRLAGLAVDVTVGAQVQEVRGRSLALSTAWGASARVDAVDAVVFAIGRTPSDGLAAALAGRHPDVRCIGDARAPRGTDAVVHEGEAVGRAL
jgi:2,4-dienoyl-CoA reductase-like NADH-dependent reductase (Old Yellow Enzyme family)/thioredoxin reductase